MIQEWKNVEFQFGRDPLAKNDFVVSDFGSRMTILQVLDEHENTGTLAKTHAQDELKKLKKDDDSAEVKSFSISYEGQGSLTAAVFCGQPSAFFAQTALRKAFAKKMTPSEEDLVVNINLRGLKEGQAKEVMGWIATLAHVVRFRPEVFGKKLTDQKPMGKLTIYFESSLVKKVSIDAITEGQILGFCNNQVKHLADLPSNILNPATYREKIQKMVKELVGEGAKIEMSFLDKKQLQKRGANAFLAVVNADHNDRAGIVHLRYAGTSKSKKKLALVGKGLCFDTGGYNIKVGEGMYNMHRDMTGSAVALSLFRAMVELEVPYEVNAYLALAENLISHEAYRPNDVVVAANGMSIEVVDTDAEGRMVLSDTLVLASEKEPDLILDFATLTGSVVRALDTRRCGAYSNDMKFSELAVKVGDRCGERVWNFPIGEDYNDSLKSEIADIRQCASSNASDHIYAATFLSKFVGKAKNNKPITWLHVDLAADTNKGGLGLIPSETTGFGVRFGYHLANEYLK